MTGTNTPEPEAGAPGSPSSWSDEAIERLLRDLYRAEMPPELREPADADDSRPGLAAVAASMKETDRPAPPSRRRWVGVVSAVGGGLVALGMLIAVMQWAGSPDRTNALSDGQRPTGGGSGRGLTDHGSGLDVTSPVESRDALQPVGRDASDGVGLGVGPSGHEINEWDIEIYPIDEPAPLPPGTHQLDRPAIAEPAPHRFE